MLGQLVNIAVGYGERRHRPSARVVCSCESLEDRQLLSSGMGLDSLGGAHFAGKGAMVAAERGSFSIARQDGMFGAGSSGLGGGARNPILFLTAPLLSAKSSAPPTPSVMSSSAVQSSFQTLQTDLKNDIPGGATPTHASVGALQDDLSAIHKGTLNGTAAQSAIQTDQAAILTSIRLTSAQISQIQSDQQALQNAIQTASTASSSSTTSTSTSTTAATPPAPSAAVQQAISTLESDLTTDTPAGAHATHASIGAVQDDLGAIRKGTLTGSAAVTQVQTDAAAVLASMGLSQTQISQIQADQAAVQTAIVSNPGTMTTSSSTSDSTAQSTLQSVSQYLMGIPGGGDVVMRGHGGPGGFGRSGGPSGPGRFGGFGGPGFGAEPLMALKS